LKEAVRKARQELSSLSDEIKTTVNVIRPEEPVLRKVRRSLPKPLRRRVRKKIDRLMGRE
jgi:hypothetical protein